MTDEALIAAVAKRLGWTDLKWEKLSGLLWGVSPGETETYKGKRLLSYTTSPSHPNNDWLTSIDAALGVLDKRHGYKLEHFPGGGHQFTLYSQGDVFQSWDVVDDDACRAILMTFVESQEEKP